MPSLLAMLDWFSLPKFRRRPVSEFVSETREGMDRIAEAIEFLGDAIKTHAAVMASCAATAHSRDYGDQRNMAMVIYEDAQQLFKELHDRIDPKRKAELDTYIEGLCKGKRK